jgi:hypothetical protein
MIAARFPPNEIAMPDIIDLGMLQLKFLPNCCPPARQTRRR